MCIYTCVLSSLHPPSSLSSPPSLPRPSPLLPHCQGLHGDIILVSGLSTGTAVVQVKLFEPVWKDVSPSVVKLLVLENIMFKPSECRYILPLSFVDYRVERKKSGRQEVVAMPSDQYHLELTNGTVGRLDPHRLRVTGLVVGYTELVLQDKRILLVDLCTQFRSQKYTCCIYVFVAGIILFSMACCEEMRV